jgi:3-methyladenine DNA glycosylase AlkD
MLTTETVRSIKASLAAVADPGNAIALQRYFKTAAGEYGEGDRFIGVRVPAIRTIAKQYERLSLPEIDSLLDSDIHEHRLTGLMVLVLQYTSASRPKFRDDALRRQICDFYLAALGRNRVNNWDLVDSSAEYILGEYLFDGSRDLLFELAASQSVWERRVAIIATFKLIRRGDAVTTLDIAERLLDDRHDLIRKAVGWALREVGKRVDRALLRAFLDVHAPAMSSITLSYATEHFEPELREHYRALRLAGKRAPLNANAGSDLT